MEVAPVAGATKSVLSLAATAVPTFILWGDSDQVVDSSCVGVFLELIPQARAMVFPETRYLPMVERPRDSAMVLHAFFNMTLDKEVDEVTV
jgi:pimeloyl-ACP methyl ester carboxylesterase